MSIDPPEEEIVRRAEAHINKVWSFLRNRFPSRTTKEVLAMTTFQFAKSFFVLQEQVERQQGIMSEFEAELDRLLDIATQKAD